MSSLLNAARAIRHCLHRKLYVVNVLLFTRQISRLGGLSIAMVVARRGGCASTRANGMCLGLQLNRQFSEPGNFSGPHLDTAARNPKRCLGSNETKEYRMSVWKGVVMVSIATGMVVGTAMALDSRDDMASACEKAAAAGDRFIVIDGLAYDCVGEVVDLWADAPCDPLTEWCFGGGTSGDGGGFPDPRGDGRGGGRNPRPKPGTPPKPPEPPCKACDTAFDTCFNNAADNLQICLDTFQRQAQLMCVKYHRDVRGQFVSGGYACRFEQVGGVKVKICEGPGMTACTESYRGGAPGAGSSKTQQGSFNIEVLGGTEEQTTTLSWSPEEGYFNACAQLMGQWSTACAAAKARCRQENACVASAPTVYQAGSF